MAVVLVSFRAALCDDVTPGGFDGIQSKDNRTTHSTIHSVITIQNQSTIFSVFTINTDSITDTINHVHICFDLISRKQEAPRASRDEKRRAQHNEG